MRWIFR